MLPYLCGGVVMNDPFALSLIFVVPLLSVYLVIKLIFTYIALSIDNHILLKVNVDAFKYKQKLTKCFLFGFSSDLLSLIITMLVSNFKALDYINMMFFAGGNVEYLLGIVISYFFTRFSGRSEHLSVEIIISLISVVYLSCCLLKRQHLVFDTRLHL